MRSAWVHQTYILKPYEKVYRVRYRVDGVLRQIATPPLQLANRLASRLKVMSQMDISEKRVPQDGRIKLKLSKIKPSIFVLTHYQPYLVKNWYSVSSILPVRC